jgi:hypothetical protein
MFGIPNNPAICPMPMVRADPLMNPAMEGPEMKSMMNPSLRRPIPRVMIPASKEREAATWMGFREGSSLWIADRISAISSDITETGPIFKV